MICRWSRLNGQIIVIVILNTERIEKNGACRMDCKSKEKGIAYNRSNLYCENFY